MWQFSFHAPLSYVLCRPCRCIWPGVRRTTTAVPLSPSSRSTWRRRTTLRVACTAAGTRSAWWPVSCPADPTCSRYTFPTVALPISRQRYHMPISRKAMKIFGAFSSMQLHAATICFLFVYPASTSDFSPDTNQLKKRPIILSLIRRDKNFFIGSLFIYLFYFTRLRRCLRGWAYKSA